MKINSIQKFNTVNSISLFSMSIWGYIDTNSFTALIPLFFGIILFSLGALLNKEKLVKISAHLIVLFTLMILVSTFCPGSTWSNRERWSWTFKSFSYDSYLINCNDSFYKKFY